MQAYKTQVAVEPLCELVVRQTVTQAANDKRQLVPLAIEEQSGQRPEEALVDSGYRTARYKCFRAKDRTSKGRFSDTLSDDRISLCGII